MKFIRYVITGLLSSVVLWAVLWIFSDVMGFSAMLVAIVYTPLNFAWRFKLNKKWVFNEENKK